ncbi:LysE family translocator [Magnetococcales bacterium HHB-1]
MDPTIILSYLITVFFFLFAPGPSHLLMFSNSLSYGIRPSLATMAGDLSANILQAFAAGLGLAGILLSSTTAFMMIQWIGVGYLLLLGWQKIYRSGSEGLPKSAPTVRKLFNQGFLTSAANPKAVGFFAALFPQFIDPNTHLLSQITLLTLGYIVIDGLFLLFYGMIAQRLKRPLKQGKWLDWISGLGFIISAILLGSRGV